jgi:hypothetical protein
MVSAAAVSQSISILLDHGAFKVAGFTPPRSAPSKGWPSLFAVYAGQGDVPPMLGDYAIESGALVFHPKFPLAPGVHYRAVFRPPEGAPIERVFDGPPKDTTRATRVERVYPSADVVPSNLLRFYIYFSAPMTQGEAGRRVHVLNEKGAELPAVFLPGEELWDPNYQRLTLTLDPGRIKRGLTSNQAMGAPIVEGKHYKLVIDRDWPDARDVPMVQGFAKSFQGGPSERTKPDPKSWRLTAPAGGATAPLTVDFPKPMNYVLLQRMLHVAGPRGDIAGSTSVGPRETRWSFTPRDPWQPGDYRLIADTALEDLAGNSIALAFDIDVFERVTQHITTATTALPFQIR